MDNKRHILVIILLVFTIAVAFFLPKVKYQSINIISKLQIPLQMDGWRGKDVSLELNLKNELYNFIGDIFARIYANKNKENLLFLILDAGNFHNPKVCFGSSGFKAKELPDLELKLRNRAFKGNVLYMQKGSGGLLLVYWICIDKKITAWAGQKVKELIYSLFNKKKAGLMMRLDIPTKERNIENSLKIAEDFIKTLESQIPPEQADYIFGKPAQK